MNFAKLRRYGIVCILATLLILAWSLFSIGQIDAKKALVAIQAEPLIAPIIFILILVVSTIVLLPLGLGLNLGAGIVWGAFLGGALTILGSLFAAVVAFLLARTLGGRYLKDYSETPQARSFLNTVKRHDWKLIFLTRLNPIVPFGLQNYLFGLTGIPLARYSILSLLSGAIPAFLYASIGESINDLVLTGDMRNLLTIIGLALLLITIGYLVNLHLRKPGVS